MKVLTTRDPATIAMTTCDDFGATWGFPSEVAKALGAISWDVRLAPTKYNSGRERYRCYFLDGALNLIEARDALMMTSKRNGRPYHMVKRERFDTRKAARVRAAVDKIVGGQESETLDNILDELTQH